MSMASAVYAEYAEKVRKEWVEKLKSALYSKTSDDKIVAMVSTVVEEMDQFYFSE